MSSCGSYKSAEWENASVPPTPRYSPVPFEPGWEQPWGHVVMDRLGSYRPISNFGYDGANPFHGPLGWRRATDSWGRQDNDLKDERRSVVEHMRQLDTEECPEGQNDVDFNWERHLQQSLLRRRRDAIDKSRADLNGPQNAIRALEAKEAREAKRQKFETRRPPPPPTDYKPPRGRRRRLKDFVKKLFCFTAV